MADATFRCFDCGHVVKGMNAGSASFVGRCPECPMGMLLVYTLADEPVNRDYFDMRDNATTTKED